MPALGDLFFDVVKRENDVLESNPQVANNNITTHGSNLLWAICALHAVLFLGVLAWTFITKANRRVFHYISLAVLFIATIYYFVMASNLGSTPVFTEFRDDGTPNRTRQIFYARWIGYFLNWSLIFFALTLLSGVGWATILFSVGLAMTYPIMLLSGSLVQSSYKWGFFLFALVALGLLAWQTLGVARTHANRLGPDTHKVFASLAAYEIFWLMLYPIAFGVSEGGNRITNDSEQIFYCILDVFSQGLFALGLLFLTRRLDFDHLGLGISEYGRIHDHDIHNEKRVHGTTNGTHATTGTTTTNGAAPVANNV